MEMHQEPMMLGSPVANSPSNTSLHHTSASQYLPGFLMGDHSVSNPVPVSPRTNAGQAQHLPFAQYYSNSNTFSPKTSPPKVKFGSASQSRFEASSVASNQRTDCEKDKPGAPPVSALINESSSSYSSPAFGTPRGVMNVKKFGTPLGISQTVEPRKILGSASNFTSPPSPSQNLSAALMASADDDESEAWVTVFGFPPATSSYVLQQFSRCGTILEHHLASDGGNWIHIKFESKLQAKKALLKSGKIFSGNIMIGVNPCSDSNIIKPSHMNQENFNASSVMSPLGHTMSSAPRMTSLNTSRINSPKPATMRAVTSAYSANASELKVFNDTQTPQKSTGIVTKTWDYLFG